MKQCEQCKAVNADEAQFCYKCGAQLGASQPQYPQQQYQQQQYQQPQYQQPQYQQPQYQQPQYQQPQYQQPQYQQPQYQQPQYQQPQYQQPQYQEPQYQQPQYQQPQYQQMGFGDAIRVCLKEKYASFEGRATRAEYWYFALFYFLVMFGAVFFVGIIVGVIAGLSNFDLDEIVFAMYIAIGIICLPFLCPAISVLVRRLHDTGHSGWWCCLSLIPSIGSIAVFVFMLLPSQRYYNEYGPYVKN